MILSILAIVAWLTSPKYFLAKAELDTLAASSEPDAKVYFVFKSLTYLFFIPSSGHLTKLDFDSEDFDTDSAWDTSTQKFTVPAGKGGKYFVGANAYVLVDQSMYTQLHIYKNGSSIAYNYNSTAYTSASLSNNVQRIITLAATDTIEFYVSTNASTRTVYSSNNIGRTVGYLWRLTVCVH